MKSPQRILLLENIHALARDLFIQSGYEVETLKEALPPKELIEKLKNFQVLGIRSKTNITAEVLENSSHLSVIGCFCVGTNQVDLPASLMKGIPVFNAPFSNTRSVAEMAMAEVVMLARQIGARNNEMHQGIWNKTSTSCYEVRGKTLGIIGYGNIGTQVSMLAEAFGMRVVFYDIVSKLTLGNAKPMATMQELLEESDFVTVHVPSTELTFKMLGREDLKHMKKSAYLINASRGDVVDLDALQAAIDQKNLAGAALDVFPEEPEMNTTSYENRFKKYPQVILTPHIGGATEEAQHNIGREVAGSLIRFLKYGSTLRSVNFPHLDPPTEGFGKRLLNIHKNVPGVLKEINRLVTESGANIQAQALSTNNQIGYLLIDVDQPVPESLRASIQTLKTSIHTKII